MRKTKQNMITVKTAPISVNALYRGRRFLTREGKMLKEKMAWEIKPQWGNIVLLNEIRVNVWFYFKTGRMDIDNALKGLLDCMTGIVWKDDKQIIELHVYKFVDKKEPRIEIEIL